MTETRSTKKSVDRKHAEADSVADSAKPARKRSRISQSDIPSYGLDQALRVPRAIFDEYAGKACTPLQLAKALDMAPASSTFRMLTGAAIAFGLTEGGYNSASVAVTPLATQIVRPLSDGLDEEGRRRALLAPRVTREFLTQYDGSALPRPEIAHNVLESLGVPRDRVVDVYEMILSSCKSCAVLTEIRGKLYVQLQGVSKSQDDQHRGMVEDTESPGEHKLDTKRPDAIPGQQNVQSEGLTENKRIFITHGKNKSLIEPIKKLLAFGELEAVVAVESASVAKPVPDKVMAEMRSCGGAIIHVDAERELADAEGNAHRFLNENVLIEIGAAMALYGRRFILLVRDGITLPSNLQGLFEVRYRADDLGADKTIELLDAINKLKKEPLLRN